MLEDHAQQISAQRLDRLPVFPLPSSVLIPQGLLPLHVFEPRYRELVQDCLDADGVLAVALMAEEEVSYLHAPKLMPVVGVGRIDHHELFDDGRSLIILRGLIRAELMGERETDTPYRLVRARPLLDLAEPANDTLESVQLLKRLVHDIAHQVPRGEMLARACREADDVGCIADLVAAVLMTESQARQQFLAERSRHRRIDLAADAAAAILGEMANGSDVPRN